MDILKTATDWAKAEMFSTAFFIYFGIAFILLGIGFWQLGKTDLAKAYIFPAIIAGTLLMIIGLGLFFTNKTRVTQFEEAYKKSESAFVQSEIERTESTLKEYKNVVFTAIPIIIAICAILLIFFKAPLMRASMVTSIAMLIVILLIDGTAHARIQTYHKQLISITK